jgi:hypothetical protein
MADVRCGGDDPQRGTAIEPSQRRRLARTDRRRAEYARAVGPRAAMTLPHSRRRTERWPAKGPTVGDGGEVPGVG